MRITRCERCEIGVDDNEYVVNFGLCESCFSENCPCNEGRPESCPLHAWPDVVLARDTPVPYVYTDERAYHGE